MNRIVGNFTLLPGTDCFFFRPSCWNGKLLKTLGYCEMYRIKYEHVQPWNTQHRLSRTTAVVFLLHSLDYMRLCILPSLEMMYNHGINWTFKLCNEFIRISWEARNKKSNLFMQIIVIKFLFIYWEIIFSRRCRSIFYVFYSSGLSSGFNPSGLS